MSKPTIELLSQKLDDYLSFLKMQRKEDKEDIASMRERDRADHKLLFSKIDGAVQSINEISENIRKESEKKFATKENHNKLYNTVHGVIALVVVQLFGLLFVLFDKLSQAQALAKLDAIIDHAQAFF